MCFPYVLSQADMFLATEQENPHKKEHAEDQRVEGDRGYPNRTAVLLPDGRPVATLVAGPRGPVPHPVLGLFMEEGKVCCYAAFLGN